MDEEHVDDGDEGRSDYIIEGSTCQFGPGKKGRGKKNKKRALRTINVYRLININHCLKGYGPLLLIPY